MWPSVADMCKRVMFELDREWSDPYIHDFGVSSYFRITADYGYRHEPAGAALDRLWGPGTSARFADAGLCVEWSGEPSRDRFGAYWSGVRVVRAAAPAPVADAIRRLLGASAPKMENHGTYVYFGVEDSLDEEEEDVLDALDRVWGEGTASRFAAAGLVLEWSGDSDRDGSGVYWSGVYVEQALAPEEA